ncbi:MAG: hypothetical protein MAG451_00635 [Anaerolineales bacterium]|nr:hypothetical protein [Anaerolineales bacterium]
MTSHPQATGPRLPVAGNNAVGDHVVIAEITVTE